MKPRVKISFSSPVSVIYLRLDKYFDRQKRYSSDAQYRKSIAQQKKTSRFLQRLMIYRSALLVLVFMVLLSCGHREPVSNQPKPKSEYELFDPICKWKMDSMQILNKAIDAMPFKLRLNKYISDMYQRNIDSCIMLNEQRHKLIYK
jgi:hypothetical protein